MTDSLPATAEIPALNMEISWVLLVTTLGQHLIKQKWIPDQVRNDGGVDRNDGGVDRNDGGVDRNGSGADRNEGGVEWNGGGFDRNNRETVAPGLTRGPFCSYFCQTRK